MGNLLNEIAVAQAVNPIGGQLGIGGGKTFWVSSVIGSNTNNGRSPQTPYSTLANAITKVTNDKNDVIYLMAGHAETTTAIAASKTGFSIIGLGTGRLRPALTATTAATDLLNVSGANIAIKNVRFVGAASGCTALLDIGAADFYGENLVFEHGAAPTDAITVPASSHRFALVDCIWRGTAAGPDKCIKFEGKVDDWRIVRPRAHYGGSSGLDDAFLFSSFKMKGYLIDNPIVVAFDTLAIDINSSSAAVGDGVCRDGTFIASTTLTSIEDAFDVGGCAFSQNFVCDDVSKTAGRAPITSAS